MTDDKSPTVRIQEEVEHRMPDATPAEKAAEVMRLLGWFFG